MHPCFLNLRVDTITVHISHTAPRKFGSTMYRLHQAFSVCFLFFLSFVFDFSLSSNCPRTSPPPQMSNVAAPLKRRMYSPPQTSNVATLSNVATPLNFATAPLGHRYRSNVASPPRTSPSLKRRLPPSRTSLPLNAASPPFELRRHSMPPLPS